MFLEVNQLRGLIINVGSDSTKDQDWVKLSQRIPCCFIVDNDVQQVRLQKVVNPTTAFLKKVNNIFAPNLSIKKAIQTLGLQPYEVAYVTSNPVGLEHVLAEPIGTILIQPVDEIRYENIGHLPDFIVTSIDDIQSILNGQRKGYFAEVNATRIDRMGNQAFYQSGHVIKAKIDCHSHNCLLISCGRYFSANHSKDRLHQLSHRIRKSKRDTSQEALFTGLFSPVLNFIHQQVRSVDAVTRVPARPGTRDRLFPIIDSACAQNEFQVMGQALTCEENYESQKNRPSREARIDNVKGKFRASPDVRGKHIILVDDIFTTGATISECAAELMSAGASQVTLLTLAINQFDPLWGVHRKPLLCPACDGHMRLMLKRNGLGAFFGCSNFWESGCKQGIDFIQGWQEMNTLNAIDWNQEDDSEESIWF